MQIILETSVSGQSIALVLTTKLSRAVVEKSRVRRSVLGNVLTRHSHQIMVKCHFLNVFTVNFSGLNVFSFSVEYRPQSAHFRQTPQRKFELRGDNAAWLLPLTPGDTCMM